MKQTWDLIKAHRFAHQIGDRDMIRETGRLLWVVAQTYPKLLKLLILKMVKM